MKVGDKITVDGCRNMVPRQQTGTIERITPTGRVSVKLPSGAVVKFDAAGYQLGREYPDYTINIPRKG